MRALLSAWHDSGDAATLTRPTAKVFSRGDSNLLNWLWTGQRIGCVDFEFAGYSAPAFDAADLIEHISARDIPDSTWQALLPDLRLTDDALPRFHAAQRTCALRWLAVLWKQRLTRTPEFTRQLHRVDRLLPLR